MSYGGEHAPVNVKQKAVVPLRALVYILITLLVVYGWLIIARAILSWIHVGYNSPVLRAQRLLFILTEPYLRLFRRILPAARFGRSTGLDFSTLLGLIVLFVVIQLLALL